MTDAAAVVLAAGPSRRLGMLKQLLTWRGGTLLWRAVSAALGSGARPVVVVTGAGAEQVTSAIADAGASIVHNTNWRDGMGSSIATGVRAVLDRAPGTAAVIVMACDQPAVDAGHLAALAAALGPGFAAAASEYDGVMGIPAIFSRELFSELLRLEGDHGARAVLERALPAVARVALPGGGLDVDTAADLARLEPPVIETERLVLRPLVPDDAMELARLAGERAVAAMTLSVPHPYSVAHAERFIGASSVEFDRGEGVTLAITARDGRLLGAAHLRLERAHGRGELGYWVGLPYWGHGYATEGARALVDWAFRVHRLERIVARVFAVNSSSRRVLEKLGMKHEGTLRRHFRRLGVVHDAECFGVLREEWEARDR